MNVFTAGSYANCGEQAALAEEWVSVTMKAVLQAKERAEEDLRSLFGTAYAIDEMAVLCTDEVWAAKWAVNAVRVPGITMFNSATDHVTTRPVRSEYDVHYLFLSAPEEHWTPTAWRMEVMYPHPGSPLHDTLLQSMAGGSLSIVHASFKCASEEDYALAVHALGKGGYEAAQLCESTYGRFSYWARRDADDVAPRPYLKPRVNLRDIKEGSDDLVGE